MSDIPFLFFAAWEIFMTIPHQLILDENNEPAFAVIPYSVFRKHFCATEQNADPIPEEVKLLIRKHGFSSLKAWRIHLGFTMDDMAEKLEISHEYYRKIENGEPHYPVYDRKIAELLDIPENQIWTDDEIIC